jgi:hypothetical protein
MHTPKSECTKCVGYHMHVCKVRVCMAWGNLPIGCIETWADIVDLSTATETAVPPAVIMFLSRRIVDDPWVLALG